MIHMTMENIGTALWVEYWNCSLLAPFITVTFSLYNVKVDKRLPEGEAGFLLVACSSRALEYAVMLLTALLIMTAERGVGL